MSATSASSSKSKFSKKHLFRFFLILLIVSAFILYYTTGLNEQLTFENLKLQRESLTTYVSENYIVSVIVYILAYILIVTFSLPGASIMTLAGGMIFGLTGIVYVLIGATVGATLVFLATRFVIGDWVQTKFAKPLAKLNQELETNGANYIFSARLFPFMPFWLLNLISGVTRIPTSKYILATSVGIIPGTAAYVYTGTQLGRIDMLSEIVSPGVIGAFVVVALVAFIPTIIKKFVFKSTTETQRPPLPPKPTKV